MNRFGIALAADSAVTIGQEKVWKSTNKIFSLGPHCDIAMMVYGGGDFVGYPWEVVIKTFKRSLETKCFETVRECAESFAAFLAEDAWDAPIEEFVGVSHLFIKEMEEINNTLTYNNKTEFRQELKKWVEICKKQISGHRPIFSDIDRQYFSDSFYKYFDKYRRDIFESHIPKYILNELFEYVLDYFNSEGCNSGYESGVVFAGFGGSEYYPVVHEIIVDGKWEKNVRIWCGRSTDFNDGKRQLATVVPFAQRDMANVFMEGISSSYIAFFIELIEGILERKSRYIVKNFFSTAEERRVEKGLQAKENDGIIKDVAETFTKLRHKQAIEPLMESIRSLPREEMAAMAEALVELTSLRRKIDSSVQSVAGPVDVMFISKADGPVWMKRKHYFESEINHDFFARRKFDYEK